MTTWILILTLWSGEGVEQKRIVYGSDELCQKAGVAWMLEQKRLYGPAVRSSAYCLKHVPTPEGQP